ncbi:helix-turn-helix transcriptional regulator [Mycolicibacter senuensis]|uniref:ArsR family transcriptional regulator n=1 Tax=Mycolicibacter senuensis TaxID=386913 RepID=A0A7I9XGP2_9MYCO|nr:helix-turn-helix domain-containing protein [Mycolicibacter senuensis]ORW65546.1 ArsR family transcriptional regulator [Mycolicibacter senuensis]GFG69114.1 ArsR family transcriptional regulator [Mycolicibacter senuensis]
MSSSHRGGPDPLTGLSSLDDPVRQRLYHYVASCDEPVAREQAATAAGISRTLAAYHLDKLAEAGILSVSYARPAGRSGPGAGRPAKRYARTRDELSVSVPPRNYRLLADLLVTAMADDHAGTVRPAISAAARRAGRAGAAEHGVFEALREFGYEPVVNDADDIELRNCPFELLARRYTEAVCGLNLQLIEGMLEGAGEPPRRAKLTPSERRCCVTVRAPGRGYR